MAAALVTLEKSAKGGMQKFFKYVPAVVLCYLIAMLLCTLGVWDMAETKPAYSALKNNLTYAMIFAMLLRCNIRKVLKLGPKMLIGFFSATLTIIIALFTLVPAVCYLLSAVIAKRYYMLKTPFLKKMMAELAEGARRNEQDFTAAPIDKEWQN